MLPLSCLGSCVVVTVSLRSRCRASHSPTAASVVRSGQGIASASHPVPCCVWDIAVSGGTVATGLWSWKGQGLNNYVNFCVALKTLLILLKPSLAHL